jgi:hypothetical protein
MKDGGSAFPVIGKHSPQGIMEIDSAGMTLRDWFAGQSLHAIVPRPADIEDFESVCEYAKAFAKTAYEIADAMVEAREERNDS